MTRTACVLLLILLVYASAYGATVPIEEIKEIDSSGLLVDIGRVFTVAGVVTVPSGAFNTTDLDVYVQDRTAGINVVRPGAAEFRLELGDSVIVTGVLDQELRGNAVIRVASNQDIEVVGRGTVPDPVLVTAEDLSARSQPPLEAYEGRLVKLETVSFDPADWPQAGSDKQIAASDPTGTFNFRIDRDTDIDGTEPAGQPTILIGVVIQDDGRFPYLDAYVVWPRSRYDDFSQRGNGSGAAALAPSVVEIGGGPFDLEVTLSGNSIDTISHVSLDLPLQDGWSWDPQVQNVEISGPGLSGAEYALTETGITIEGGAIYDAEASYGTVTLKGIMPPGVRLDSRVVVMTSVDGTGFGAIFPPPVLKARYPKPDLVINEIYPHDGSTQELNSFIELHNRSATTARLEGFALCEQRSVPYCDPAIRYVFGSSDTIPPDGYFLVIASLAGFETRFALEPPPQSSPVEAAISPLGRVEGDGGICGKDETYELITLWRDETLTDLVTHREYTDRTVCAGDLCSGFGDPGDAFPYIPPIGYSLLYGDYDPCCPYQVLSSDPTPGAPNVTDYESPSVDRVKSHDSRTVEVFFSEPMDVALAEEPSHYVANGIGARSAQASLSSEKVLVLFPDLEGPDVELEVSGVTSMPGVTIPDTTLAFRLSTKQCPALCDIQDSDDQGFSPFGGEEVCALGFITVPPGVFQPDYSSIYIQGLDGCGVNVFSYDVPQPRPVVGDFVSVTGEVTDYVSGSGAGATTEIFMGGDPRLTIVSRGYPEPDALVLTTAQVSREIYEGRLVETEGTVIEADSVASFYIDDGSGGIQIYQNYTPIDFTKYELGMYVKVRGVVLQYDYTAPFFEGYELVPRYESDIEIITDAFPAKAALDIEARVFCPSCGEESFPIGIEAPERSDLVLRVFDAAGRDIVTLYDGSSVGALSIAWDGRDARGDRVPAGLYICYLECVELGSSRKMTDSAPIVVGMKLR